MTLTRRNDPSSESQSPAMESAKPPLNQEPSISTLRGGWLKTAHAHAERAKRSPTAEEYHESLDFAVRAFRKAAAYGGPIQPNEITTHLITPECIWTHSLIEDRLKKELQFDYQAAGYEVRERSGEYCTNYEISYKGKKIITIDNSQLDLTKYPCARFPEEQPVVEAIKKNEAAIIRQNQKSKSPSQTGPKISM